MPQHSIAALADLSGPVDLAGLIHAPSAFEVPKRLGSSIVAMYASVVTGPGPTS
jgi:hypothetical protein